jgi:23S rRNA pseudouridine1911/1915/1917 synthase
LDQALAKMFPEFSRSRLKAWVTAGDVLVDGEQRRPRDAVDGGERIELAAVPETAVASAPERLPLSIVFEDDDLLVIDKPAGLVVHPGAGNASGTLMNGLLYHAPELAELPRAGIIHRIDKDTTGLLLVAKSLTAHTALVRALADREIERAYVAVCEGVLTGGGTVDAPIDAPIGRHRVDRTRMAVVDGGRPAVTHYTVRERYRAHTLVDVKLDTGRTHQIRVHFAHRRHPLVGDPVYGRRLAIPAGASEALGNALREFRRQALHAARLRFAHPASGTPVAFDAPLPADFERLLALLREDAR